MKKQHNTSDERMTLGWTVLCDIVLDNMRMERKNESKNRGHKSRQASIHRPL